MTTRRFEDGTTVRVLEDGTTTRVSENHSADWVFRLTVTDNDGATHSTTLTIPVSAIEGSTGSISSQLSAFTQAVVGLVPDRGAAVSTLPKLSQAAAGTVADPVDTGSIASTLPGVSQAALGTVIPAPIAGTAASVLQGLSQTLVGNATGPTFAGTAENDLLPLTQAAIGLVPDQGAALSTLPPLSQAAAGSVAAPVYTGASATTLKGFRTAATQSRTVRTTFAQAFTFSGGGSFFWSTGLSPAQGDVIFLTGFTKSSSAFLQAPTGWATVTSGSMSTGSGAADNDSISVHVLKRVHPGGPLEINISTTGTGLNLIGLQCVGFRGGTDDHTVRTSGTTLSDTTAGTPLQVSTIETYINSANTSDFMRVGDLLFANLILNGDAPTFGASLSMTSTGATIDTPKGIVADGVTTLGTDARTRTLTARVTEASRSFAATTITQSLAGTTTTARGVVPLVHLRSVPLRGGDSLLPLVQTDGHHRHWQWLEHFESDSGRFVASSGNYTVSAGRLVHSTQNADTIYDTTPRKPRDINDFTTIEALFRFPTIPELYDAPSGSPQFMILAQGGTIGARVRIVDEQVTTGEGTRYYPRIELAFTGVFGSIAQPSVSANPGTWYRLIFRWASSDSSQDGMPITVSAQALLYNAAGTAVVTPPNLLGAGSYTNGSAGYTGMSATGDVEIDYIALLPAKVSGYAGSTLPKVATAALGTVFDIGSAVQILPAFGQTASGTVTAPVFTGTATSSLQPVSQAAIGLVPDQGAALSTLPTLSQAAAGTHVAPPITFVAQTSWAASATSFTPALPTGVAVGDLLVLFIHYKYDTAVITPPGGWNYLGSTETTLIAEAGTADTGDVGVEVHTRIYDGIASYGEFSFTGDVQAHRTVALRSTTGGYLVTPRFGLDTTTGSAGSITFSQFGFTSNDDYLLVSVAAQGDVVTMGGAVSLTSTGVTFADQVDETATATTVGTDMRMRLTRARVFYDTSGTSTLNYTTSLGGTVTNARLAGAAVSIRHRQPNAAPHTGAAASTMPKFVTRARHEDWHWIEHFSTGTGRLTDVTGLFTVVDGVLDYDMPGVGWRRAQDPRSYYGIGDDNGKDGITAETLLRLPSEVTASGGVLVANHRLELEQTAIDRGPGAGYAYSYKLTLIEAGGNVVWSQVGGAGLSDLAPDTWYRLRLKWLYDDHKPWVEGEVPPEPIVTLYADVYAVNSVFPIISVGAPTTGNPYVWGAGPIGLTANEYAQFDYLAVKPRLWATGTSISALSSLSQAAIGLVPDQGAALNTLPSFSQAATGTVVAPVYTGAAASTLVLVATSAVGVVADTGTIASTLPAFSTHSRAPLWQWLEHFTSGVGRFTNSTGNFTAANGILSHTTATANTIYDTTHVLGREQPKEFEALVRFPGTGSPAQAGILIAGGAYEARLVLGANLNPPPDLTVSYNLELRLYSGGQLEALSAIAGVQVGTWYRLRVSWMNRYNDPWIAGDWVGGFPPPQPSAPAPWAYLSATVLDHTGTPVSTSFGANPLQDDVYEAGNNGYTGLRAVGDVDFDYVGLWPAVVRGYSRQTLNKLSSASTGTIATYRPMVKVGGVFQPAQLRRRVDGQFVNVVNHRSITKGN